MPFNRFELKLNSKKLIAQSTSKVIIVSCAFVALSFLLSLLYTRLSGASGFMNSYMTAYTKAYQEMLEAIQASGTYEAAYEAAVENMQGLRWPTVTPVAALLTALIYVLSQLISAGYTHYCMLVSRGLEAGIKDLFNGFYYTGKLIVLMILRALLILLGFVCLIVPGFVLLYCYRLSIYVAFDEPELGPIACLRKARQLSKGKKMELFTLDISFIGWYLLGNLVAAFLLPLLDIWTQPYMGLTVAQAYNIISGYKPEPAAGPETPEL